jgi:hypothetical protein
MGIKIARCSFPIIGAVAHGAPTAIHGIRITPGIRKMCQQLGISEAEWIASAKRRAQGRQDEILGSLGRKSIERTVDGEREIGMPTGFRNV